MNHISQFQVAKVIYFVRLHIFKLFILIQPIFFYALEMILKLLSFLFVFNDSHFDNLHCFDFK